MVGGLLGCWVAEKQICSQRSKKKEKRTAHNIVGGDGGGVGVDVIVCLINKVETHRCRI